MQAKLNEKERKARTRGLIQIGAIVVTRIDSIEFAKKLQEFLLKLKEQR